MKRTSLASRNAFLSPSGLSAGVIVLVLVIIAALVRLVAPNTFLSLVAPVFTAGSDITSSIYGLTSGFRNAAALAQTNDTLMNENANLSAENRALTEKLSDLTALVGTEAHVKDGIVAGVVARPPESTYDSLILAAGTNDGVTEGMLAFGPNGVPLGHISSVTEDFSRLSLFSTSGTHVNAWLGSARLAILLDGQGGGTFTANVPRSLHAVVGDLVFISGPGTEPIGTVAKVGGDPSDPGITLIVKSATNLYSTTWVLLRPRTAAEITASSTPFVP